MAMEQNQSDQRGAYRYEVDAAVHGEIGDQAFEGHLQDVSATGAAITGVGDVGYENDQFVSLHMEGLGSRSGYIRRAIPNGFALQFHQDDEEEQRKLEAAAQLRALGRGALDA